jgi:hypothetical protein
VPHKNKESYYVGDTAYALREIFDHADTLDRKQLRLQKDNHPKRSHAQAHAFVFRMHDLKTCVRLKGGHEHNLNVFQDPDILSENLTSNMNTGAGVIVITL